MENLEEIEVFSNNVCFDCFSETIEYCSLNNAIFICTRCAQEHVKLGKNVSFLIKITKKLDPYLAGIIQRGGNDRLYKFLMQFNLNNTPIMIKYKTVACEWYRRLLYSEANCEEPPQKLPAKDYITLCLDSYIMEWNFEGYKFEDNIVNFINKDGVLQDLNASTVTESGNYANYKRNLQSKKQDGQEQNKKIYEIMNEDVVKVAFHIPQDNLPNPGSGNNIGEDNEYSIFK